MRPCEICNKCDTITERATRDHRDDGNRAREPRAETDAVKAWGKMQGGMPVSLCRWKKKKENWRTVARRRSFAKPRCRGRRKYRERPRRGRTRESDDGIPDYSPPSKQPAAGRVHWSPEDASRFQLASGAITANLLPSFLTMDVSFDSRWTCEIFFSFPFLPNLMHARFSPYRESFPFFFLFFVFFFNHKKPGDAVLFSFSRSLESTLSDYRPPQVFL